MPEDDADDSAVVDTSLVDTVDETEQVHRSKAIRRRVAVSTIIVVAITLTVVAANWPRQASRGDVAVRAATAVPTTDTTSIGSFTAGVRTTDAPTSTEAPAASYAPIGLAPDVTAATEPTDALPGTLIAEPEPTTTESTTTMLVCHNSTNPACGPFYYDPALTNEPGTVRVEASPSDAQVGFVAGQDIFFAIITQDPDSAIWGINGGEFRDVSRHGGGFCGWYDFGEGEGAHGDRGPGACVSGCPEPVSQYGPWEPPPKHPTDDNVALITDHNFAAPGTYKVSLTITLDPCGPRLEELTGTTTVHILG
jgi:hypothetical protein